MLLIILVGAVFVSGFHGLPLDDDAVVILDELVDNGIEGEDSIDLSSLGPNAYGSPKNESGDSVATWTENSLMNPEEMGEYAEGDILIPQYGRNGLRDKSSRWENGIVPYMIDSSFNKDQKDTIMKAIADYHRLTCLRFVPYNGQKDYLLIKSSNTGCWSSVGRIGGRQEINLQTPGCVAKKGTVIHELLHALGFLHEQSRVERDDFIEIHHENIRNGAEPNFKKADSKRTHDYGVSYDYNSVMHYSDYAFSKNSKKTIVPKINNVTIGQRDGLSRGDVKKLNNMYNCKKEVPATGWLGQVWQSMFGSNKRMA